MSVRTKVIKQIEKAKYTEIPPNPKRLIHALREMGYTSFDAILDLVDNSIDAKATHIAVHVRGADGDPVIDILDNGVGMDKATLNQALTFGSDIEHNASVDLGKYGMGLNSAGISLARNIWVLTRQEKQQAWEATFDIDVIERHNKWDVLLHEATGKKVVEHLGDRGTLIRLSRIDRGGFANIARFAFGQKDKETGVQKVQGIQQRMGQVYRHFIQRGVVFTVNGRIVPAEDPLLLDHELTETVLDQDIELAAGKKAHLTVVELPEFGQQGDAERNIYPENSGIYVVRNGRQIMDAQTFGFYKHHHSYSHFRAELSFDGSLDNDFHVDIKKGSIYPDHRMLERLRAKLQPLWEASGRRGRTREEKPIRLSYTAAEDRVATIFVPTPKAAPKTQEKPQPTPATEVARIPEPEPAKPVTFTTIKDPGSPRIIKVIKHEDGRLTIAWNTSHKWIAKALRQPGVPTVLGDMASALTLTELEVEGGELFVNKLSETLASLASAKV